MFDILIRRILMVLNVILIGAGILALFINNKILGTISLSIAIIMSLSKIGLYEKLIKDLNSSIDRIDLERSRFSDENLKLSNAIETAKVSNIKLSDSIEKMKMANAKLIEIQNQSQKLLSSLMSSGDKFTDFGKILEDTTNKNLSLAQKMEILVNGLSEKDFKKMDANNDGIVTAEEFKKFISTAEFDKN